MLLILSAGELKELHKREKEMGIVPEHDIDAFMRADAIQGKKESLASEYVIRILGLDVSRISLLLHNRLCSCPTQAQLLTYSQSAAAVTFPRFPRVVLVHYALVQCHVLPASGGNTLNT